MATETKFTYPVQELHGAVERKGVVHRKKTYRLPDGKIIGYGKEETFKVKNPRDYKNKPPKEREQANLLLNQKAWRQAALELQDSQSERYQYWLDRFLAQIKHGESEAPVDPTSGKHKVYRDFRAFVRAAIRRQLLASMTAE